MMFDVLGRVVLVAGYSGIAVLGARKLWRCRSDEIIAADTPTPRILARRGRPPGIASSRRISG